MPTRRLHDGPKRRPRHRGHLLVVGLLVVASGVAWSAGHPKTGGQGLPAGSLAALVEPAAGYGFVVTQINGAHDGVEIEMYELDDPAVLSALETAQRRGVAVKVLLDRAYHGGEANAATVAALRRAGVRVSWADPSVIDHEKAVCIDLVCDILTGNLTPTYYPTSRDFVVIDRRPGDVEAIEATFAADWTARRPGPAPLGDDLVWSPGSGAALIGLIASAKHSLLVESEEMAERAVTSALVAAALRGVDVEVAMTKNRTYDAAIAELRAAGVHVTLYASTGPLYIHAKAIVADHTTAFVGSENFSYASLDANRELGLVTSDPAVVEAVSAALASDMEHR